MVQSTDARISAAHTQCVDTRAYACTNVRVAGVAVRTCSVAWARSRSVPTIRVYAVRTHIYVCVSTHCLHVDSITTRVGTCT